jgi:hypothetical protein
MTYSSPSHSVNIFSVIVSDAGNKQVELVGHIIYFLSNNIFSSKGLVARQIFVPSFVLAEDVCSGSASVLVHSSHIQIAKE